MRRAAAFILATASLALGVAVFGACDDENTCGVTCPVGTQFTNDGTCACVPFDAGYCGLMSNCPNASCPASETPDACGGGQLWSTTLCGCYPIPEGGVPKS